MKNKITKNSKNLIILVLALSGIALFSMMLYLSFNKTLLEESPLIVYIFLAIIVIEISGVLFKRLYKKDYSKKLTDEYYTTYEKLSDIFQSSTLSLNESKEVLNDILDILLSAQEEQKPINEVVGDNLNDFARGIEASYGRRNSWQLYLCDGIIYSIIYLVFLHFVDFARGESSNFFDIEIGISFIFFIIAISFVAIPLIRIGLSTKKYYLMIVAPALVLGLYIGTNEFLYAKFLHIEWAYNFTEGTFRLIPNLAVGILFGAILLITVLAKTLIRKYSISHIE